jgi:hypothetical protein
MYHTIGRGNDFYCGYYNMIDRCTHGNGDSSVGNVYRLSRRNDMSTEGTTGGSNDIQIVEYQLIFNVEIHNT